VTTAGAPVVIGVGEEFRHDDGVGPAVVAELRGLAAAGALPPDVRLVTDFGEPTGLIELWRDARLAIVVDAAAPDPAAGLAAGDVMRWEAEYRNTGCPPPPDVIAAPGPAATHVLGPGAAIALASVLGRLPTRLVLFAVVGEDFSLGSGLSPHVADAVRRVARDIVDEIRAPGLSARANGDLLSWPGRGAGPRLGS
jgi:hydrogenase maturation protease